MTSRQASDQTSADVSPTYPAELPGWLAAALISLTSGAAAATYRLEPEPESVTDARHFAAATLRSWGLGGLADDVTLVVSELVTNALRHSLPPHSGESYRPGIIRLHLLGPNAHLLAGVYDSSPEAPRRREPDFVAETGRGLHIVESFSDRWGWTPAPTGGKVVWALFGPAA
jgi:hypothetical protein